MPVIPLLLALLTADPLPGPGETSEHVQFPDLGDVVVEGKHKRRHGWDNWDLPQVDPTQESFVVIVPPGYTPEKQYGLFVYISPSSRGWMVSNKLSVEDLKQVLAERDLIYIAPNQSQNKRRPLDRLQLALMAASHAKKAFTIDPSRVIVGGMSGGAKMACISGRFDPEMFRGVLAIVGASFHERVFADERAFYPPDMRLGSYLDRKARQNSAYAFVTGPNDFNWVPIQKIEAAYRKARYESKLFAIDDLGHEIPDSKSIAIALDYLLEHITKPETGGR